MPAQELRINEIFYSIQGESSWTGWPCVFVRLTGCHLRCHYCDTEYAFHEGEKRTIESIVEQVCSHDCPLIEITGGEPLLQPGVYPLMKQLCDLGKTVLLETSGACSLEKCDPRVIRIVDFKTPGSGEADRNDWSIIDQLTQRDELKFVITDRADYEWAREIIAAHDLARRVKCIIFTPVVQQPGGVEIRGMGAMDNADLAQWILEDALPVRFGSQLHKAIWPAHMRGV